MRGKLTVFFGAAPGVGKTSAMLEAARIERVRGRDVVIGVVDTHGRYEAEALLLGLEILPRSEGGGLDLDAALARKPSLLVVDDLAHAASSRHAKRWQEVEELRDAGIDVFTTLEVRHLESQRDVVSQVTDRKVEETVPDALFEQAEDVRLVDLPTDEGGLIALRELALRLTAQRVDHEMRRYREAHGIDRTWPVVERLLVSVSPSPDSERLVRATRRLATMLRADWIAAYVETPAALRLSKKDRERVGRHLQLAQSLGAETITLGAARAPEEIVRFARARNVTRIIAGKPTHPQWRDRLRPSFLDELVRQSGDIEVQVLPGDAEHHEVAPQRPRKAHAPAGYAAAIVSILLATVLGRFAFGVEQLADVVMVYLLAIVLVALRWGIGPSLTAAVLAVLSFDFFFIPPYYTFAVADFRHVVTFAVMFLVATIISGLTKRVRDQADAAREREIRTASLYSLSRALAAAKTTPEAVATAEKHVDDVFGVTSRVLLRGEPWGIDDGDRAAAEWALEHGRSAGAGTDTLTSASATYVPLEASGKRIGVVGVRPRGEAPFSAYERELHLEAFARQIAAAIDRTSLAEEAGRAQLRVEAEQHRNALLSSVSHDLRTPLAVITGNASTLLDPKLDATTRKDLTETIVSEADRLGRLLRNLLDMTRLDAGAVRVEKEWQPLEEAVGAALARTEVFLGDRPIEAKLAADLPLVPYDSILLQQVLVNLLENAAKYTPEKTPIEISATPSAAALEVVVADRGPGIAPGEEARIFEKFHRGAKDRGGVGLGLAICRGIVVAHGGRIWAENREGGGAAFHFTLPIEGEPPRVELAS